MKSRGTIQGADMTGIEQAAASELGMQIQHPQRFANNMLRLTEEAGKAVAAFVEPRIGKPFESSSAADIVRITKTFAEIQQAWLAQHRG